MQIKIAIIDDDINVLYTIQEILEDELEFGDIVLNIELVDSQLKLENIDIESFDVAIIDWNLQGFRDNNGYELAKSYIEDNYQGLIIINSGESNLLESKKNNRFFGNLFKDNIDKKIIFIQKLYDNDEMIDAIKGAIDA